MNAGLAFSLAAAALAAGPGLSASAPGSAKPASSVQCCGLSASARRPAKPASSGATGGLPFAPGESITYEVTVLGAEVGVASVDLGSAAVVDGVSAWPIVIRSRSAGAIDRVFPVRDRFVSWWDPVTRRAVECRLDASEGGKVRRLSIRFRRPPASGVPATAEVQRTDRDGTVHETDAVDPDAEDLAAAVAWLRCQRLRPGERYTVPVFTGKKQWPMGATVVGAESVQTPAGRFDCVHVEVSTAFDGKLATRHDLDAWFSADARHLPVRLDADLPIGRLRAEVSKVEN